MIFVFHGKDSSAKESKTVNKVKSYFEKEEIVYAPSYDSDKKFHEIFSELSLFVKNKIVKHPKEELVFVGCSLGGYWAKKLANHFKGKLIMLNPSLRYYGKAEKDEPGLPVKVLVGMKDEVVDPNFTVDFYKDRAYVIEFPDGDHQMHEYLDEFVRAIEKSINTYVD